MQHPLIATQPLTIGDILDRSARLLRARFSEFVLLPLLFLVPLAVLQAIAIVTAQPVPVAATTIDPNNPLAPLLERFSRVASVTSGTSSWSSWIGFANMVIIVALPLIIIYQSIQILHGRSPTISESIKGGLRHTWRYLLTILIFTVLVLLAALVVIGVPALCIGPFGIFLFIPLLFFFIVRVEVYMVALVNEHAGPIYSLQRSWALTEGLFWRTFGFTLVVGILTWVITFLPAVITSILIVTLPPGSEKWLAMLDNVSGNLIRTIVLPFSSLATVMYYFDLLVRKEGYDLALRLQETESGAEQR